MYADFPFHLWKWSETAVLEKLDSPSAIFWVKILS